MASDTPISDMLDKIEYDYYIIIDGQEVKADYCYNNLGAVYCEINNIRYENVPYKIIEVNRIRGYNCLILFPLFGFLLIYLFIKLLRNIIEGSDK